MYIVNRGNRAEITSYPDRPLDNAYSLNTVDVCPVGALTSKDFRFKKRVWFLHSANSICTGCSRGCNTFLEHHEGVVYRLRPRENMEVNRYWMCDEGRVTYKALNDERLDVALVRGEMTPIHEAMASLAQWIKEAGSGSNAGRIQVLLSPLSPLESLYAWKRFAADVLGGATLTAAATRAPMTEDELLRKADPYPNRAGLEALGLANDPEPGLKQGGEILFIVDDDPIGARPEWNTALKGWKRVVYLGSNENATAKAASLALPTAPHAETDGTFVNFQGRIQRFEKGMVPQGDALWMAGMLTRIAKELGIKFGWGGFVELFTEMTAKEPALAGLDLDKIGSKGTPLSGRS